MFPAWQNLTSSAHCGSLQVSPFTTLTGKHPEEDEREICNLTVQTQGALESYGISETLLNIMEGANALRLAGCVQVYTSLRYTGLWCSERERRGCPIRLPWRRFRHIEQLRSEGAIKRCKWENCIKNASAGSATPHRPSSFFLPKREI